MNYERRAEEQMTDLQKKMSEIRYERLTDSEFIGKKIAYIMRGVPGSGKSTVAKEIAHPDGVVHSTDAKFYDEDGNYAWDPKKLKVYHHQNYEDFCGSLENGFPVVVVDNTNIKKWNYAHYEKAAQKAGYVVRLVEMPSPDPQVASERNIHGVSKETIERMIVDLQK